MRHSILLFFLLVFGQFGQWGQAQAGHFMQLKVGQGYFSPAETKNGPAVVIVPDDYGVTPFMRAEADRWAKDFAASAIVVDFLRGKTATDDKEVEKLKSSVEDDYIVKVIQSGVDFFKNRPAEFDSQKIAILCFTANCEFYFKNFSDLSTAKTIFLMSPFVPAQQKDFANLKADLNVFAAASDTQVSRVRLMDFEKTLKTAGVVTNFVFLSTSKRRFWDYTRQKEYDAKSNEVFRKAIRLSLEKNWGLVPETPSAPVMKVKESKK